MKYRDLQLNLVKTVLTLLDRFQFSNVELTDNQITNNRKSNCDNNNNSQLQSIKDYDNKKDGAASKSYRYSSPCITKSMRKSLPANSISFGNGSYTSNNSTKNTVNDTKWIHALEIEQSLTCMY